MYNIEHVGLTMLGGLFDTVYICCDHYDCLNQLWSQVHKITNLIRFIFLNKYPYLSGILLGGSKNMYTCSNEIRLRAHNMILINIIEEDLYDHSISTRIFGLVINKGIRMSSTNYEKNGYNLNLDLLIFLY